MSDVVKSFLENGENDVLFDVRSPAEYNTSHIPGAISFPLFTDEERALVGTAFKQVGQSAAIELGLDIVGPKLSSFVRNARQISNGRSIRLYCWRGGMRSSSMAWLLKTAGMSVNLLPGGYKAYRKWVVDGLAQINNLLVIGGMTGAGKTEVLYHLQSHSAQVLDLEGLAHHKGSAFGNLKDKPQPSSEMFNNLLWQSISCFSKNKPIWIEDESRTIGSVYILEEFYQQMQIAPIVIIEKDRTERAQKLAIEYGALPNELLKFGFEKIRKKLGGQHVSTAVEAIDSGNLKLAAEIALVYYDKSYQHTLSKRTIANETIIPSNHLSVAEIGDYLLKNEFELWKRKSD